MFRLAFVLSILLVSSAAAAAQTAAGGDSGAGQELRALVREMHDTLLRCDKDRLFTFFAEEFIGTSYEGYTTTKPELMKTFRCPPPEAKIKRDIEGFKIRGAGESSIVSYELTERFESAGNRGARRFLYTDTFVRREGRWQMISSHATRVLPERKAVKVDPALLEDYAGRYAANPEAVFTVARDGDRLTGRAPNGETVALLPESDASFFVEGRDIQMVFERDKTGQVRHMVIRRGGEELRLERID